MPSPDGRKFSFIWNIENFSHSYLENGQHFTSPAFVAENAGGSKWCVELYPKGFDEENGEFISCFLRRFDDSLFREFSEEIAVDFSFSVIGGNGEILGSHEEKNKLFKKGGSFGCLKLVKIEDLSDTIQIWQEDILTIRCSLISHEPIATEYTARFTLSTSSCSFVWSMRTNYASAHYFYIGLKRFQLRTNCNDSGVVLTVQEHEHQNSGPYLFTSDIALLESNGAEKFRKRDVHLVRKRKTADEWQFKFLASEQLSEAKYRTNADELPLACKFWMSQREGFNEIVKCKSNPSSSLSLQRDLRALLLDKKHADVKLRTNGHDVSAHRSLLAARSPVFSAMFDQEMIETKTGVIDVPDVNSEILKIFLEFLYTGTIKEFEYNNTLELLVVADKYQVSSLCELCSSYLVSQLSVKNACEVICLADMINNESLKTSAMKYLTNHAAEVMGSTDWKGWMKKNHELSAEIISYIVTNFTIVPKKIDAK